MDPGKSVGGRPGPAVAVAVVVVAPLAGHGVGLVVRRPGEQREPAASLQVSRQRPVPLYCIATTDTIYYTVNVGIENFTKYNLVLLSS